MSRKNSVKWQAICCNICLLLLNVHMTDPKDVTHRCCKVACSVTSEVCSEHAYGRSALTYEQLQALCQAVCTFAPPASLIAKGADQLAGSHQTLLPQTVCLLQRCQLCLSTCQLLLQGLHLLNHLPACRRSSCNRACFAHLYHP